MMCGNASTLSAWRLETFNNSSSSTTYLRRSGVQSHRLPTTPILRHLLGRHRYLPLRPPPHHGLVLLVRVGMGERSGRGRGLSLGSRWGGFGGACGTVAYLGPRTIHTFPDWSAGRVFARVFGNKCLLFGVGYPHSTVRYGTPSSHRACLRTTFFASGTGPNKKGIAHESDNKTHV